MPLEPAAYHDLRQNRVNGWELELQQENGTAVLRVGSADPRLAVTDNEGTNTTAFVLTLSGDDGAITLPTTVDKSEIFNDSGVSMTGAKSFDPFTFATEDDQLTVTHNIVLPS